MSKRFNSAERSYPTHDRGCVGIVSAYREWRCYLEGVPSTCYTDHKPLTQLQSQPQISRRQARWLEFLASFQPNVVYVQGKYNPADVLSRPPHELIPTLPDLGQGTSGHPSPGSSALSPTETASGPNRTRCVNPPAAREGCSNHPGKFPCGIPSRFPTCTIGTADAPQANGSRPISHSDVGILAANFDHTCRPTRMGSSVTAILLNAVNPVTYHPVLPMLTGAQAREWWVAAYNSDHLFRDPKLIHRYQLTQKDDFWYYNTKLLVVPSLLRKQVLSQCHDALTSAHFGRTKTLNHVQRHFWWPGYRRDTTAYVKNCLSCARNKPAQHKPYGPLSPLPVPDRPWGSVSMDFITDLPMTKQKHDAVLVVVCRLTKMAHFIPCAITCTAQQAADLLIQWVFRLHGTPDSFVVDRDARWRSMFYRSWCQLLNIDIGMSTAFHPQSDGQTERMNRILEEVLRHYINPSHTAWEELLPWAEFAVNSAFQESIQTTPFVLNYGWQPSSPFELGLRALHAAAPVPHPDAATAASLARERIQRARKCLQAAQDRQKHYADAHRAPLSLTVGQYVLLSSKNIKIATTGTPKLLPRYLGPFQVVRLIGTSAVKLALPAQWKLHPVFHVSLLKPCSLAASRLF